MGSLKINQEIESLQRREDSKNRATTFITAGQLSLQKTTIGFSSSTETLGVALKTRQLEFFCQVCWSRKQSSRNATPFPRISFAITAHKSQGSEFNNVFVLGLIDDVDNPNLINRELVYTAITRAKTSPFSQIKDMGYSHIQIFE